MKTHEDVLSAVRNGRDSACIDGRDYARLIEFFPGDQWEVFGYELKEGATSSAHTPKSWTRETIVAQLESDVVFGIGKAKNQRGISSNLMYEVVKMWLWILDDPLQHHSDYDGYGLAFFEEVRAKYFVVEQE